MGVCNSKPKRKDMIIHEPTILSPNTESMSQPKLKGKESNSMNILINNTPAPLPKPRARTHGSKPQPDAPLRQNKYTVNGEMMESPFNEDGTVLAVPISEATINVNGEGKNQTPKRQRSRRQLGGSSQRSKPSSVSIGNNRSQSIGSKKELQLNQKEIEIDTQKQTQGQTKFKVQLFSSPRIEGVKRTQYPLEKLPPLPKNFNQSYTFLETLQPGTDIKFAKYQENTSKLLKAAKCIRKIDKDQVESVMKEIRDLALMDHSSVMSGLDFLEDDKFIYIVHEFCGLGDLSTYIQQRKLNEYAVQSIMFQLLKFLNYLHRQNKVMLSLSSRKIYLSGTAEQPLIKILEFEDLTEVGQINKQVLEREKNIFYARELSDFYSSKACHKFDIWSAGIIFYQLLSKEIPQAHKHNIQLQNDKNLAHVSQDALDLLKSLLNPNRESRPTAFTCLKNIYFKQFKSQASVQEQSKALQSMIAFKDTDSLQQAAMMFIVNNFANSEISDLLRRLYSYLDQTNDGYISKENFIKCFKNLQPEGHILRLESLFHSLDINGNGKLDYLEFAISAVDKGEILNRVTIGKAFDMSLKKGQKTTTKTAAIQRFIRATPNFYLKVEEELEDIFQVERVSKRDFSNLMLGLVTKN